MPRDYEQKMLQNRIWAKTPAGAASKKASQLKWLEKRKIESWEDKPMIAQSQALTIALNNWR